MPAARDGFVALQKIFGHGGDERLPLRFTLGGVGAQGSLLGAELLPFGCCDAFDLRKGALGGFDLPLEFFTGDHAFEQAIFGPRGFSFRVLDLVLQRLVGFVGFYFGTLLAVLARLLFPGVHIHFVCLAVFQAAGERFLGGGNLLLSGGDALFDGGQLFGHGVEARAQLGQAQVHGLQFDQPLDVGKHAPAILVCSGLQVQPAPGTPPRLRFSRSCESACSRRWRVRDSEWPAILR